MLLDTRFMLSTKGDIAPFCKIFLFVDSTCCQQDFFIYAFRCSRTCRIFKGLLFWPL